MELRLTAESREGEIGGITAAVRVLGRTFRPAKWSFWGRFRVPNAGA